MAKYFSEISRDTGKYCFGVKDTLQALELGAVEDLIVWENLDVTRYSFRHPTSNEEIICHLNQLQEKDPTNFNDSDGIEYDITNRLALLEWLANHFKDYGARLNFVTNKSQEGSQFCKGFGGIGGMLRYKVDFQDFDDPYYDD